MSYVALSRGGTSLTVPVPPIHAERYSGGGADRAVALTLDGGAVVTEWPAVSVGARIEIEWKVLAGSLITTLKTLIEGAGPVNLYLYPGASAISCMFGSRSEQSIKPLLGDYPDTLADGSSQLAARTQCAVRLVLYRI